MSAPTYQSACALDPGSMLVLWFPTESARFDSLNCYFDFTVSEWPGA
jgi:hypothetical protein